MVQYRLIFVFSREFPLNLKRVYRKTISKFIKLRRNQITDSENLE